MSDATPVIQAQPIVEALQPLITTAVGALVAAIVGIILSAYNQWKARTLNESAAEQAKDEANRKLIMEAAENEAKKLVGASVTGEFANKVFTLGSPEITQAANTIIGADAKNLKTAIAASGMTQDRMESLVLGAVGDLQVRMSGPTVPPGPAVGVVA